VVVWRFFAAVGSNPTWSERLCQDRKICEVNGFSSEILFKALNATPFVLVASTPLDKGERLVRVQQGKSWLQCCALHQALSTLRKMTETSE